MKYNYLLVFLLFFLFYGTQGMSQTAFKPGNIVVSRMSNGAGPYSTTNAVYLDEYTTTGTFVRTLTMPNGTTPAFYQNYASAEGCLTRSTDGRYLTMVGYTVPAASGSGFSATSSIANPRVIGLVKYDGTSNLIVPTVPTPAASGAGTFIAGTSPVLSTITLSSVTGTIAVGQYVYGNSVPNGATVASVTGTSPNLIITLSVSGGTTNTGTVSYLFMTTATPSFANAYSPGSAITTSGTDFWLCSRESSIQYYNSTSGALTNIASGTTSTTARALGIFDGQLYGVNDFGFKLMTIGTGLPTAATSTAALTYSTSPNTFPPGQPRSLLMLDVSSTEAGSDVLYVVQGASLGGGGSTTNNAIIKYKKISGVWTITGGYGAYTDNYYGLTGAWDGTNITLYAIRKAGAQGSGGELVKIVDASGYTGGMSATETVLAAYNTGNNLGGAWRGIAFAPTIPTISTTGSLAPLNTTYGTASASETFSVSGTGMLSGILVTPPPGFEVSTNNTTFSSTVTVGAAGTIASTPVYIRLSAASVVGNAYAGNVVLSSSGGATNVNVATSTSAVTQAALSITANNVNKIYGATLTAISGATAFTASGLKNSETIGSVSLVFGSGFAATDATGNYTGSVTPSAATGGSFAATNYIITYNPGNLVVAGAALTVTATGPNKTYGTALTSGTSATNFTVGTLVNGETVTAVTLTPDAVGASASASVGSAYTVVPSGATGAGGFAASNYSITYVPYDGTVTRAALIYTATAASRVYGASNPTFAGTVSGFVNGDTQASATTGALSFSSAATNTSPTGTYAINGSGLSATNYTFNQATDNSSALTVTPAILSYVATAASRAYGSANPTLSGSISGFVNGDTQASATTGTLSFSSSATTASPAGTYAVNGAGLSSTNYTFNQAAANNAALTVTPAPLIITANNISKTMGVALTGSAGSTAFTAAGLKNSETAGTVTITYGTGAAATDPVGTYTGSVVASALIGGSITMSNYTISYLPGNIIVGSATISPTGTLTALTTTYGTASANTSFKVSAAGLFNDLKVTAPAGFEVSTSAASGFAGNISLAPSSGSVNMVTVYVRLAATAAAASYSGNIILSSDGASSVSVATVTSTVAKATLTYIAATASKVYGSSNPTFTGTLSGFVNSDTQASATTGTLAFTTTAATTSPVGTYAISGGGLSSANYNFIQATANASALTITPATLTYVAAAIGKTYGSVNPALTGTVTGFVGSDTQASATTGTLTFSTTATTTSPVGSYAINGAGLSANNYTLIQAAANATALTVNKATLFYTATAASKVYGAANPALSGTVTGFTGSDTQSSATTGTLTFTTTATTASGAGSYAITGSGLSSANYTFNQAAANTTALTVTQAILTVTAGNATKVYGAANPAIGVSYSGFVNGDGVANLTTQPSTSTTALTGSPVGAYPVTPGGAVASNYTFNYVAGTLTVSPANLAITANNQSRFFGQANPALTVTYSGFVNGDTNTNLTVQPTVSTTATLTSLPGTYPITASGAVSPNYTIGYTGATLTILPITNANLSNLSISAGSLSPVFTSGTLAYSASVPNTVAGVTITATAADATATIQVNGVAVTSGSASGNILLSVGLNVIAIKVTAQNGSVINYSITVTRDLSINANLVNLTLNTGTLSPVFDSGTTFYTVSVMNSVNQFTITPISQDANAIITVNGTNITSGTSLVVNLAIGDNTIRTLVTAQDGTTRRTYTVIAHRGVAEDAVFAANILSPNGDGKNDFWIVKDIQLFPNSVVKVFDRAGHIVFQKTGYTNDWAGTFKGALLPQDTYYYVVDLGEGSRKFTGYITLLINNN